MAALDAPVAPLASGSRHAPPGGPSPSRSGSSAASQAWGILTLRGGTIRRSSRRRSAGAGSSSTRPGCWPSARRSRPAISAFGFGYGAPGVQGSLIAELLGDPTRVAAIVGPATVREQAVWITGMVVAGVAGTAICADLGARKVRDELAALQVMGVDPIRTLVAPRVLAHDAADAGARHRRDHHRGDRDHARQPPGHRHGRRLLRGDVAQLHDDRPRRQPRQDDCLRRGRRAGLLLQGHEREGRAAWASAAPSTRPSSSPSA